MCIVQRPSGALLVTSALRSVRLLLHCKARSGVSTIRSDRVNDSRARSESKRRQGCEGPRARSLWLVQVPTEDVAPATGYMGGGSADAPSIFGVTGDRRVYDCIKARPKLKRRDISRRMDPLSHVPTLCSPVLISTTWSDARHASMAVLRRRTRWRTHCSWDGEPCIDGDAASSSRHDRSIRPRIYDSSRADVRCTLASPSLLRCSRAQGANHNWRS
jgi:hypothetical protein